MDALRRDLGSTLYSMGVVEARGTSGLSLGEGTVEQVFTNERLKSMRTNQSETVYYVRDEYERVRGDLLARLRASEAHAREIESRLATGGDPPTRDSPLTASALDGGGGGSGSGGAGKEAADVRVDMLALNQKLAALERNYELVSQRYESEAAANRALEAENRMLMSELDAAA